MITLQGLRELVEVNYPEEVKGVIPVSLDVYKVETLNGYRRLVRVKVEPEKLLFSYAAVEMLREQGLVQIPEIHLTNERKPYCSGTGGYWVLQDWVDGRKVEISNLASVQAVTRDLALLHSSAERITPGGLSKGKKEWTKWGEKVLQKERFYQDYLQMVRNLAVRTDFQAMLLAQGELVQSCLKKSVERILSDSCQEMIMREQALRTVALSGMKERDFLLGLDGKTYFLNLFKVHYDVRMKDLGLWIKRLTKKLPSPLGVVQQLLTSYEQIRPLSKGECAWIWAYLNYPEKVLKVVESYAYQKKRWTEEGYVRKLRKTLEKLNQEVGVYLELENLMK